MKRTFLIQALAILLFAAALDAILLVNLQDSDRNSEVVEVSLRLATLRAQLEKEITSNLLLIKSTSGYISLHPDLTSKDFDRLAREVLRDPNMLKNLAAAPDFVMRYVYPLAGNEAVLGMDYRKVPAQWDQARAARDTGRMVLAGPLNLIQGGLGIIGRSPVFIRSPEGERFWGLVSAVIDADQLFAPLEAARYSHLDLAIRGKDGSGAEGEAFIGDTALFHPGQEAVTMAVNLPSGSWQLAGIPIGGWRETPPEAPIVHGLVAFLTAVALVVAYLSARRQSALLESRGSLNEAQAIAHLGNWTLDLKTDRIWWSEESYRIFGFDPAETEPSFTMVMERVPDEERKQVEGAFRRSLETGEPYIMEHSIILPHGDIRHIQARGKVLRNAQGVSVRATGTILDITDRKLAENALQAEEAKMRAMMEAAYDANIMIDAEDNILYWSPSAERMFGWTEEEAMGRSMHHLIAPEEYRKPAADGLKTFATTGHGPVMDSIMEFPALRKDGSVFPVERSVAAFELDGQFLAVGSLRDVTARKQAEEALQSSTERISLASEAGGVGIWEWDVRTGKLVWNPRMYEIYGVRPSEFEGVYEAWRSRVHPDDLDEAAGSLEAARKKGGEWNAEFRLLLPDGSIRHIQASARAHVDEDGVVHRMIGINLDITERKEARLELERLATTDTLTGLYNRRHFLALSSKEIERNTRYGHPLSAIMFDADKFKNVNDTYGHDVGDMVLRSIASTALGALRDMDILGRIGGEEFAVLLPETDTQGALLVAERIRASMAEQNVPLGDGGTVRYTVSLGVAERSREDQGVEALLKLADQALYKAKENGRNRVEIAEQEEAGSAE